MDFLTREEDWSVKAVIIYRKNGSKITQTIRWRASQFQSAVNIIRKPRLSSSDIKEAHTIIKAEETSISNDGNMLVPQLRQLVDYYTRSYTLKGLEGNLLSGPNNNIINSLTGFLVDFSSLFEESQIQGISHCWPSSCIHGKNKRKKTCTVWW